MKLCLSGEGQHLLLDDILDGLKLNFQQFQNMCIVAGCDYLHNVRGVGIRGAYKIISSSDDIFSTLENKGAPSNYKDHFNETKAVFSHQTVFDVDTLKTVPLHMWESNTSTKTKHLCGKYPLYTLACYVCPCGCRMGVLEVGKVRGSSYHRCFSFDCKNLSKFKSVLETITGWLNDCPKDRSNLY